MTYSQITDSLRLVVEQLPNDSSKVKALNDICLELWDSKPDSAIFIGLESMLMANDIGFLKGAANAQKIIGMGYYAKGDYLEVLNYWQQSLATFDSLNDKSGVSNLLMNIGAVYFNQGDDAIAIDYYLRSLRVAEEIGDTLRIASAYLNIGNVYLNKEETYGKSLEYLSQGLKLSEILEEYDAIGNAAVNIGEIYFMVEDYDSALYYFEKALQASEIDGNTNLPYSLNNIGKVYLQREQYGKAIDNHEEALKISIEIKDQLQMAQSLIGIGNGYKDSEKYQLALQPYLSADSIAKDINALKELKEIYEGLSHTYSQLQLYSEALQYQSLLTKVNYSLYNAENDKKLERLQFSYDMEAKQKEIDLLVKDSLIQEANVKRQRLAKNAFLIGFVLIIIIALIIYRNYKNKVKTNQILDEQNQEIENLLLNILPEETAKELQKDGYATPKFYESVTVLFTDFKGFTKIAEGLKPHELIAELNSFFNAFDDIIENNGLEKIKTIGDAYMCAGGIPTESLVHPLNTVKAGLEMQLLMHQKNELRIEQGKQPWELRVGIHTGPVVAGVVGRKKYAYDIWGDTVNIASRMESKGEVGKVNISAATYELIKHKFDCTYRGKIEAKNKGQIDMYFLEKALELV